MILSKSVQRWALLLCPKGGIPMTEKQKRFCDEYLIDLNGTRAYKTAYPSVKSDDTAAAAATRMLRNVKVHEYIEQRTEELRSARTATAAEVMEFLTGVMRNEDEGSVSRLKAAELLGKRFGLFTDKVNVSGSGVVQIVDDIPDG
jgi:phage terminase small subunit